MENSKKRKAEHDFQGRISSLKLELQPLFPLPQGSPHKAFPRSLLAFHLLTEAEMDAMAKYYHQADHSEYTYEYPECMNWDPQWLDSLPQEERCRIKKRKIGKFIGLRGCDTPSHEYTQRIQFLEQRMEKKVKQAIEEEDAKAKVGFMRW
jgi:hypothetical protein